MAAPDLLQNPKGGRIVSAQKIHLRHAAIGEGGPKLQTMPLAMFLRNFEALDGFIEVVHLREHVATIQTNSRKDEIAVRVLECFLRRIVMGERFAVAVQTVVDVSERDLECCKIVRVICVF